MTKTTAAARKDVQAADGAVDALRDALPVALDRLTAAGVPEREARAAIAGSLAHALRAWMGGLVRQSPDAPYRRTLGAILEDAADGTLSTSLRTARAVRGDVAGRQSAERMAS